MQTELRGLEKCGAMVFTKEIFYINRAMLLKAITVKILDYKETAMGKIYMVGKYRKLSTTSHVAHSLDEMDFKCSCQRMKSFRLPCIHIIAIMVHLDVHELQKKKKKRSCG